MGSEVDQASPQPRVEEKPEVRNESQRSAIRPRIEIGQVIQNVKQLKSFEILKSAVSTFSCSFKFMLLMILSIIPLCAFMVFYEIKLQKTIESSPSLLRHSSTINIISVSNSDGHVVYSNYDEQRKFFSNLFQLCLFYFILYPLLEIFSVVITIKFAAKVHCGEGQLTLKQVLCQNKIEGPFITYLCVHLLLSLTLLGHFWVGVNYCLFSGRLFNSFGYQPNFYGDLLSMGLHSAIFVDLLSIGLHSAIFLVLLYKYLGWSAFWNMSMVISVLEEETGIGAFGLSDYYGKHCKRTGFQLMLVFFAFGNVLRLPSLLSGLCNSTFAGILVTAGVIGLLGLGNLVKWVAFVLYYYDCKQQVMEKKGDEEVGKSVNKAADAC